jgi:hypothetical protein
MRNHLDRLRGFALRRRAALSLFVKHGLLRLNKLVLLNLAASSTLARNSKSSAIAVSRSPRNRFVRCGVPAKKLSVTSMSLPPVLETTPSILQTIWCHAAP